MAKRFGGQYELKNVEIRTSTLEARNTFFELIWEMKPEVVFDLTRLFNFDSLPTEWKDDYFLEKNAIRLFLYHTQHPAAYSLDLTPLGFDSNIRNTPFLAYFNFLHKNQSKFEELKVEGETYYKQVTENPKKRLIEGWALNQLLPDWSEIKSRNDSEWLCKTLTEWSERWNLTDDWCLDFALDCLKIFKTNLIDEFQIPKDYLQTKTSHLVEEYSNFWQTGFAWKSAMMKMIMKNQRNYISSDEVFDYKEFHYVWSQRNKKGITKVFEIRSVYLPLNHSKETFRKKTQEEFTAKFFEYFSSRQSLLFSDLSEMSERIRTFAKKLDRYISNVETRIKPYVNKTVVKKDGDKHFRWLIENSIEPVKSQEELAQENQVERKSIKLAINGVKSLIGFNPKRNSGGRPKGTKDSYQRIRRDNR